jgi:hypothetical protein
VHDPKHLDPLCAWNADGTGIDQRVTSGVNVAWQKGFVNDEDDFYDPATPDIRMRAVLMNKTRVVSALVKDWSPKGQVTSVLSNVDYNFPPSVFTVTWNSLLFFLSQN